MITKNKFRSIGAFVAACSAVFLCGSAVRVPFVFAAGDSSSTTVTIPPGKTMRVPIPPPVPDQPPSGGISGWGNAQAPAAPPVRADEPAFPADRRGLKIGDLSPDVWEQGGVAFTRMLGTIVVPIIPVWRLVNMLFSGWEQQT